MGQKKHKAERKKIRKEIRAQVGDSMGILSSIVRPRPQWIPKKVWVWFYLPVFPKKYLHIVYKYLD
jgi:hypothetical protein